MAPKFERLSALRRATSTYLGLVEARVVTDQPPKNSINNTKRSVLC